MKPWAKIEEECREKMRVRRLAYKTEVSYIGWIRRYYFWLIKAKPSGAAGKRGGYDSESGV